MGRSYADILAQLSDEPRRWLITGVAGFIGSHLLETLLGLGQDVTGLDNFATGFRHNLEDVRRAAGEDAWRRFDLIDGDIRDAGVCREAARGAHYILHQAALGSVPRSIEDPLTTNESNIDGFLNMIIAARDAEVRRFVYASSSATYGDLEASPKVEAAIGRALSPYAVTKRVNELYADVFTTCYGLESIGLRYFNVFGPRQDPQGAYAAVIPRWITAVIRGEPAQIFGDGETSRDFCYIDNAVQANILAACAVAPNAVNRVYNIAYSKSTSLNGLFGIIKEQFERLSPSASVTAPEHRDFRPGDIRHSLADISAAQELLGYAPSHSVSEGLAETVGWYQRQEGHDTG